MDDQYMSALLIFAGTFMFVLGVVVFSGGGNRNFARIGLTTRRRGLIALVVGVTVLTMGISMQS